MVEVFSSILVWALLDLFGSFLDDATETMEEW
jgi:hypothetical protein